MKRRQANNGSIRLFRSALSRPRSLTASAVTAPLEVLELPLLLVVVLLDIVVDGAGVVCEPAPDPVEGPVELAMEEPGDVGEALDDSLTRELDGTTELAPELVEVSEAGPDVVSDSRGTVEEEVGEVLGVEMTELGLDVDEDGVELDTS